MTPPLRHPREPERLASLRAHQILDTAADQTFDDLARLAAQICGVPIALVSLVDEDRQWFKARYGTDLLQTNRNVSFCGHAICDDATLVVEDATQDERFRDNPLVTEDNGIRFYAGAKVCDDQGLPMGTLCIIDSAPHQFSDEQKSRLEQLANLASRQLSLHRLLTQVAEASVRDELTGLLNREGIIGHIQSLPVRQDQTQAVVYLDLKRFKPINDCFGLIAGDEVLRQVASRLELAMDQAVTLANGTSARLARVGADEFVVAILTRHNTDWVCDTFAQSLIDALRQPFHYNDKQLFIDVSVGIAASLPGQRLDPSEALSNADIAMYQAKHNPRGVLCFDQTMRDQLDREILIEQRLHLAIQHNEITAGFEPIVDLHTGRVLGFEALARWTDSELGRVRPDQFIPIAERTGLIDQVFEAVATQALATYKEVSASVQEHLWFSVNLSKAQLTDDYLYEQLARLTRQASVDPSHLHLEVTESLVASADGMIDKLHRLRKMGHPLMLDDFGSGTSSLSCLKAYPVQWIKVDRELTEAASKSHQYAAIVHAVADLSTNLGMRMIAEGVEQADTIPFLQSMDVCGAQGWYWSKPLQPNQVADWLTNHNKAIKKKRPLVA